MLWVQLIWLNLDCVWSLKWSYAEEETYVYAHCIFKNSVQTNEVNSVTKKFDIY